MTVQTQTQALAADRPEPADDPRAYYVRLADPVTDLARIGDAAARTLARAVAIGVHRATVPPGWAGPPAWRDRFGT